MLGLEREIDEDLLQLLVDVVDEKLLKAIVLEDLMGLQATRESKEPKWDVTMS